MVTKKILETTGFNLYEVGIRPKELAEKVLHKYYEKDLLVEDLPIDPFNILRASGSKFLLLDFDKIDGFYMLHENLDGFGFIGLNKNRHIERIRFSCAHELCHHLKDYKSSESRQGINDVVEVYANKFAEHLLMPDHLVLELINQKAINNFEKDFEKIFEVSLLFGVSLQAMSIKICNLIGERFEEKLYNKLRKKLKPKTKKNDYDISLDYILFKQLIDGYDFIQLTEVSPVKLKTDFLRHVITHDHMIENGHVSEERISEILAIIRIGNTEELKKIKLDKNEIEVIGQYEMYSKLFDSIEFSDTYDLLTQLHKDFYKYAPYPEVGGMFREASARISGTHVATTLPYLIPTETIDTCSSYDTSKTELIGNSLQIELIIKTHHKLTVIHPFIDGNGRTLRALANYQLVGQKMPPVFIKLRDKDRYRQHLARMDNINNNESRHEYLTRFLIDEIILSYDNILTANTNETFQNSSD